MKSLSLYKLKIRLKLAEKESKFFRHAEYKHKKDEKMRTKFYLCRVVDTREKARHLQLAYAYLRGLPYSRVENNAKKKPNLSYLKHIVKEHTDLKTDLANPQIIFGGKWDLTLKVKIIDWLNGKEDAYL